MKHLFSLLFAGLLLCSCCSEIQLVKGSFRALEEQDETAEFLLDFGGAQVVEYGIENPFTGERTIDRVIGTVEERMKLAGDDYVRDWPEVCEQMAVRFAESFNRKHGRRGTMLIVGEGSTAYKVIFHVEHIDFGSTGANVAASVVNSVLGDGIFYGGNVGGCIIDGTVELWDISTEELLGVIHISPVKTDGSPSENARLYELMRYTGKWCGKRAKH